MTVTDFEHPQASQLRQTYAFPVSKIIKNMRIFFFLLFCFVKTLSFWYRELICWHLTVFYGTGKWFAGTWLFCYQKTFDGYRKMTILQRCASFLLVPVFFETWKFCYGTRQILSGDSQHASWCPPRGGVSGFEHSVLWCTVFMAYLSTHVGAINYAAAGMAPWEARCSPTPRGSTVGVWQDSRQSPPSLPYPI